MPNYKALKHFLQHQPFSEVPMSFGEVAHIVGPLPGSAYRHRPWWANETRGHSQAKAWIEAGYETRQVDMSGRKLIFKRVSSPGMAEQPSKFQSGGAAGARRSPLFGALKGTFMIEPDYDLTRPALDPEQWSATLSTMHAKLGKVGSDT